MKIKVFLLIGIIALSSTTLNAQRGVRIGYIDTEYILQNVPEYQEASSQLDSKVQKWKGEIEAKLGEIEQKRNDLSNESVLLTPELVKEREEDILFEEKEILDYQQKRFGPNGDLMIQKKQLVQPIQDQIFAAVQDIAANRKYDFVFDKSADLTMLYSAERFDISEQVLRTITRAAKRKQIENKRDRKAAEAENVVPEEVNEELEARKKQVEENKAARAQAAEEKRQATLEAREAKKKAALERRQKILDERAAKKKAAEGKEDPMPFDIKKDENMENGTPFENEDTEEGAASSKGEENSENESTDEPEEEEKKAAPLTREERKQKLEERKKQILEAREKARQERLEKRKKAKDSINSDNN
ncbi:MAG: OmpH family outer membrane protein [Bacteroidia bacterium]|nr:OmpH family outer membrane protein [Bacteroidia bacterium]NND09812.1 OmpH family outer membrane protein [Flavobacteriaceae bacterium]MBT8309894.1 OmpH family outer membrane protein [Bacteroidia bacterium]NNK29036.1 OmpH family outer membrane protein [Flavobacteriaceae bacterium]NNL59769.1 OmpH family outer membrane protein [Flavobacteriaceae bacterium]